MNKQASISLRRILPVVLVGLIWALPALAGKRGPVPGGPATAQYWCIGQGTSRWSTLNGVPIPPTVPAWSGDDFGFTAPAATADGYLIQVNYWDSVLSNSSIGYSAGVSCIDYDTAVGAPHRFKIDVASDPSVPRQSEIDWAVGHPAAFPWLGNAPFVFQANDLQTQYPRASTAGGPTGYPSIWLGCSWDAASCSLNSALPWPGIASGGAEQGNTDPHILPRQLKHVTSLPSTWMIDYAAGTGNRSDPFQVWDAAFDIWFDKKGDPQIGRGTYGPVRGQNDGLEIMVWMDHNHSYVDGPNTPDSPGGKNANGFAQPSGWPREAVRINNVVYDVWTARLNNPYFGYTAADPAHPGTATLGAVAEPFTCPTLAVNGNTADLVCGTEWNVVSFIAQAPYRSKQMSLDAKVFTDYILGKNGGGNCAGNPNSLWCVVSQSPGSRTGNVLACPGSSKTNQQIDPPTAPIPCLSEDWILTSVQAGFEPWVGGNTLATTGFQSYALVTAAAVQSGRTNDAKPIPAPVVFWGAPFQVVYNGCTTFSAANSASFNITLNETGAQVFPASGLQNMGAQDPNSLLFTFTVPPLAPNHGPATIHFTSSCGNLDVPIYIDPSGQIFYADGVTPVPGAKVTLLFDPSGEPVPNHNVGLASEVMQPDDNTLNPMPTDRFGSYGWNVVAGDYRVQAEKENCGSVLSEVAHVVDEPITGFNLILPCSPPAPPGGSNLTVTLAITDNWTSGGPNGTGGYCANLVGRNNTSSPLDWTTLFPLSDPGTIYDHWNGNFTQSGNAVTVSGIDWNNILQPGESLRDVGFCVNRAGGVTPPNRFRLTVTKAGAGSVTSSPAGIACGGDCNEDYVSGTSVTLSATAATGSRFAGWSGACAGTGACTVAMTAARSVTATFSLVPPALSTRLQIRNDWGAGYCADVFVTNNTSQPVDWKVTFPIPAGRITQFWNAIWSQAGSQVTAEGAFAWNNILAPGETTHDLGFCANR